MKKYSNLFTIAVIVLIVAGFFMALSDNASAAVNVVGAIILIVAVVAWLYQWFKQERR